jgi:PBP1b-binding outer membrane lipoprotein LpoB
MAIPESFWNAITALVVAVTAGINIWMQNRTHKIVEEVKANTNGINTRLQNKILVQEGTIAAQNAEHAREGK